MKIRYFVPDIRLIRFESPLVSAEEDLDHILSEYLRADLESESDKSLVSKNECYLIPEDKKILKFGVFEKDLDVRKKMKDVMLNDWKEDAHTMYHLKVVGIFENNTPWTQVMYNEMCSLLKLLDEDKEVPLMVVIHKDEPNEAMHFHVIGQYRKDLQ